MTYLKMIEDTKKRFSYVIDTKDMCEARYVLEIKII